MGFNTVAFLLNDLSSELERCPKQVIASLKNPPMGKDDKSRYRKWMRSIAKENNEPLLPDQALEVLPTFHADNIQYLLAGGNCIETLDVLRYGKDKKTGRKTVTLIVPEWAK